MESAQEEASGGVTLERVYVMSAVTGELLHDCTHPWLSEVRVFRLKRWTCVNGREDLPTDCTIFNLEFLVNHQRA